MTEENNARCYGGSERRQDARRSGEDRRKISSPVENDRRKTQRRTGKDNRQKP